MSDLEERLIRCFSSIFPGIPAEELRVLDGHTSGTWDSLATVTLAAVIQEEFGVEIDPMQLPEMTSFEVFRSYLDEAIG